MIYPDWKLLEWIREGGIEPFHESCLNPASVDLRWSGRWRMAAEGGFSGVLMLKSSIGRMGLEHLHAGFFDPGFHGTATCSWSSSR